MATATDPTPGAERISAELKYARTKGGPGRKVPKHVAFPNVNRAKLAKKCGVTESCIGKIFYRTTQPGLRLAQKIAKELGMTIEELMGVLAQRRGRGGGRGVISGSASKRG